MLRCLWLAGFLLLSACTTYAVRAPVGDRSDGPGRTPTSHEVRRGDTLYSVAFLYGLSVQELAAWNTIHPPYTIYRGQQLRLRPPQQAPAQTAKRAQTARQTAPGAPPASRPKPRPGATPAARQASSPAPTVRSRPKTTQAASRPSPAPVSVAAVPRAAPPSPAVAPVPAASQRHVFWSWPAEGRLIRGYDANSTGKKGIYIGGKDGQSVRAAAAGKVVYAGDGLSGYGRLIIIKHNNDFLSAYAHNRKLIAREGQWVKKGEVIAQMGRSGTDRTQLHFEIRKHGRPVDPLRYLPKR